VASHALLVGHAFERFSKVSVQRVITTDSVPLPINPPFTLQVVGLAGLLADAIHRLHTSRALEPLLPSCLAVTTAWYCGEVLKEPFEVVALEGLLFDQRLRHWQACSR
jgi:hypothetical protein